MIPLSYPLILSALLFGIGWIGLLLRRNLLISLMSVELLLNAANLALVAFSRYHGNVHGQVVAFFVMTLAACEAALGLAIVIQLFRHHKTVDTHFFNLLRG